VEEERQGPEAVGRKKWMNGAFREDWVKLTGYRRVGFFGHISSLSASSWCSLAIFLRQNLQATFFSFFTRTVNLWHFLPPLLVVSAISSPPPRLYTLAPISHYV
jgi:hypothetical protein